MTAIKLSEENFAAHFAGGRMSNQPSHAVESHKYSKPADCGAKLKGDRGMQANDLMGTKEVERMLRIDLENWLRWGRMRDWRPTSFKCPVGFMYKSTNVHESSYRPIPANEGQAARFERIVIGLPEKHRQAFVMYQLGRVAMTGQIKIISGHGDAARLLGMAKSKYYEIVQQAHNIVLREFLATFKK